MTKSKKSRNAASKKGRNPAVQLVVKTPKEPRTQRKQVRPRFAGISDPFLRSLLLPSESRPLRLPDLEPQRTAVFGFRQETTVTAPLGTQNGTSFLMFRDLAYPLWQEKVYASTENAAVYMQYSYPTGGTLARPTMPQYVGESWPPNLSWSMAPIVGNVTTVGEALSLVPGSFENSLWLYVPEGFFVSVTISLVSGTTAGGAFSASFSITKSGAMSDAYQTKVVAGSVGSSVNFTGDSNTGGGGWYRLDSIECSTSATTPAAAPISFIRFGYTTGGTLSTPTALGTPATAYIPVPSVGAPEASVSPTIYEEARCNASSLLLQNTTQLLNLEGTIDAGSIDIRGRSPWTTRSTNLGYFNDLLQSYRRALYAKDGLYTFTTLGMSDMIYRDYRQGGFNVFQLDCTVRYYFITVIPSASAQTFHLVYDVHHETVNDSMLFPSSVATQPLEAVHRARVAMTSLNPFMENPTHVAALLTAARRLLGTAWRYAAPHLNPLAHRAVDYMLPPRPTRIG